MFCTHLYVINLTMATLRSSDVQVKIGDTVYHEIEEWGGDFCGRKLPRGIHVMGRLLSLKKDAKRNKISNDEACKTVAKELATFWIFIGNLYPKTEANITRHLLNDFAELKRLQSYPKKQNKKYLTDVEVFNQKMSNGYNIRSDDKLYEKRLEKEYGVKVTAEEELYYKDNCFGAWNARSTGIDPKWLKRKNRDELRKYREEQKLLKQNKEKEFQDELNKSELNASICDIDFDEDVIPSQCSNSGSSDMHSKLQYSSQNPAIENKKDFLQIPIRKGHKTLNEVIIRCIVQISADYNLPPTTAANILCDVGNTVFQQNWEKIKKVIQRTQIL